MEAPELARQWQGRLDRDFSRGLILASVSHGAETSTFPVPRAEVVSMRGLDPVVFLSIPGWGRNLTGVITGYEEIQSAPCRMVRVTMDYGGDPGKDRQVIFSGNVSAAQARAMEPYRQRSLELSAGGRLYNGDPW